MEHLWAALLLILLATGWILTLLGMPGNWLMVAAALGYVLVVPAVSALAMGWTTLVVLLALASIGEVLEFFAGALGVAKAGGSRRGVVFALAGSIAGGVVGLFAGVPVPIIGPLLGAVLLAGAGAFAGAVLGEQWKGRGLDESLKIGQAAFWGRVLGTVAKSAVGTIMVGVAIIALIA